MNINAGRGCGVNVCKEKGWLNDCIQEIAGA